MAVGCGKAYNGSFKVTGEPLRCGVSLYWKKPNSSERERVEFVHLCKECEEKNGAPLSSGR